MIYEFPGSDAPIRQGDIFAPLPLAEVSLRNISVVEDDGILDDDWESAAAKNSALSAVVPVRAVTAIVISQDCDNLNGRHITLCEIRPFATVEGKAKDSPNPKGWMRILTQHARINLKWFYLPPDAHIGFDQKMAVDFAATTRVLREELVEAMHLRRGRLNHIADEHFRERLGEFFRRYPYDEWYPLDNHELAEYQKAKSPYVVTPFPWQISESAE